MNEKELAQYLVDNGISAETLAKAANESMGLSGIRIIKDLWHDYHAIPDRDVTKTGPAMHSSGAGADKAMAEYSNPAPQVSITEQYDMFSKQNIEGWDKMHAAFKSFAEENLKVIRELVETVKSANAKAESEHKKEMEKEQHMPEKHEAKSEAAKTDVASLWDKLGELEAAVAKAENEMTDIRGLNDAKQHIEQAEKYLDEVSVHEAQEMVGAKAMISINLGWKSLAKATGLSAYDLHGYGNQKDEQVPGDETKDATKDDLKAAEAKSHVLQARVERLRKALGIKSEAAPAEKPVETAKAAECKSDDKKEEMKEKMEEKKSETPEEMKAELAALTEKQAAQDATMKAQNERIAFLNQRIEEVTGNKTPKMVPVIIKSNGITKDAVATTLNDRIEKAVDEGTLTNEGADIARSLIAQYTVAGKGHISVANVNARLDRAPMEVKKWFESVEVSA